MKNRRQLELSKLAPRPRWSVIEGEAETNRERERGRGRRGFLVFFCAELRRGSGEHAGNASSWQNKPPPPPQDLTPGRTAAKPADVYVTVFPQRAGRRSAHTLTDTDAHRSDKLSKCQQMLNPLAHTNPHTHPNTHCAPI